MSVGTELVIALLAGQRDGYLLRHSGEAVRLDRHRDGVGALPSQLRAYDPAGALQSVDGVEPDTLAEVMRQQLVLVCDRTTWTVEPDDAPSRELDETPGQAAVMG